MRSTGVRMVGRLGIHEGGQGEERRTQEWILAEG